MVVLMIVTQKNGETVYFDTPIPQIHFRKLISCSLYNSWDMIKNEGSLSLVESDTSLKISRLPKGHISLAFLGKSIESLLKVYNYELKTDVYAPHGQLLIMNPGNKSLRIDHDIANLFGIGRKLTDRITPIKRLRYPTTYFIHCDLFDRNQNFFNNERSDLLAKLDVKGNPYEKIRYDASPQQPIRDCLTSSHVNSITLSVRDEDGKLFDFKDMPLEFELEIN